MVGAALVSLSAFPVSDASAVTGTTAVNATLADPIVLTLSPLQFGDLSAAALGTIDIDPATGNRVNPTGGVVGLTSVTNQAGNVLINGASGLPIDLSITVGTITVTNTAGATTADFRNFNFNTTAGGTAVTVTLPVAGTTNVPFGATFNAPGALGGGTYAGTVTVNAAYQ